MRTIRIRVHMLRGPIITLYIPLVRREANREGILFPRNVLEHHTRARARPIQLVRVCTQRRCLWGIFTMHNVPRHQVPAQEQERPHTGLQPDIRALREALPCEEPAHAQLMLRNHARMHIHANTSCVYL